MDRQNNAVGQSEKSEELGGSSDPAILAPARPEKSAARKTHFLKSCAGNGRFVTTAPDDLTWRLRPANTEISRPGIYGDRDNQGQRDIIRAVDAISYLHHDNAMRETAKKVIATYSTCRW